MPSVLVILADGFEELEAVAPVTIMRRAKISVTTVGLREGVVEGARGLKVIPDTTLAAVADQTFDAVVLPGGAVGTSNLKSSSLVERVVKAAARRGEFIAAICAAPAVLAAFGLLAGRSVTSHASVRDELMAAGAWWVSDREVVEDGCIVTSRGAGTAVSFGLHLVRMLAGDDEAAAVASAMMITG